METKSTTLTGDATSSHTCRIKNSTSLDLSAVMLLADIETPSDEAKVSDDKKTELLKVSKGGYIIKAGDSDTVVLHQKFKDVSTGDEAYEDDYNLRISDATWLKPLTNTNADEIIDDDTESVYFKDVEVTKDDVEAIKQTAAFLQTISAFPDSKLAKDYVDAMNNANADLEKKANGSGDSGENVKNAILHGADAFFAGTNAYKKVTMGLAMALHDYYNIYPFAWIQYLDNVSYFMYSFDGTKTRFEGALKMSKKGAVDITQPNCGLTLTFHNAKNPDDTSLTDIESDGTAMHYVKGMFVDDLLSDMPRIALKGLFQQKKTFTKINTDTNIIVVLSGSINGEMALGFDQTQATKGDTSLEDWMDRLFRPKTAEGIFNSVMQILGVIMMIHFIGGLFLSAYAKIRQWVTGKKPVELKDLLKAIKESQEAMIKERQEEFRKLTADKSGADSALPKDANEAVSRGAREESNIRDRVSKAKITDSLSKMQEGIGEMLKYAGGKPELVGRIQKAASEVSSLHKELLEARSNDEIAKAVEAVRPKLAAEGSVVAKLGDDVVSRAAAGEKAQAEASKKSVENAKAEGEAENEAAQQEKEELVDGELRVEKPLDLS